MLQRREWPEEVTGRGKIEWGEDGEASSC